MGAKRQTTPANPVFLSHAVHEEWLLDCTPAAGCRVCAANWKQLEAARDAGNIDQAARHASEIRDHRGGGHS